MWRIQSLVSRVWSRSAPLRLSPAHHVEDELLNSSVLSGGRHTSDSSSSHAGEDEQKKRRTSQFCSAGVPRYSALDAVGWGAAAVLFMQLCRRVHTRLSSPADHSSASTHTGDRALLKKCSYTLLIDILSRPSVVPVKCLRADLQTPDQSDSSSSSLSDERLEENTEEEEQRSDLQTEHTDHHQQEEPESSAHYCGETLSAEQPKAQECVSVDAAVQHLQVVTNGSVPIILNIIGLESAKSGRLETAFSCFLTAAQHHYSKAQFNVGVCYERGRGVQRDLRKALHYYRLAAAAGHRQAQYRCAKLLLNSRGQQRSETDTETALKLLYAAADAGLTEAQVFLAVLLSQRVDCDEQECVHYFRLAADRGDPDALLCLAQCYESGFGVSPSVQTAVRLYQQAADAGNQRARDALREKHNTDVLRSIRSAPCFSVIGQLNLNSVFPLESRAENPRPQSQPLPHSWSTGSLSLHPPVTLQMLNTDSGRMVWTLGVR